MKAGIFLRLAYLLPGLFSRAFDGFPALQSIRFPEEIEFPYFLVGAALCFVVRRRSLRLQVVLLLLQPLIGLFFTWTYLTSQVHHDDPGRFVTPLLMAGYAHVLVYVALLALGVRIGFWREFREDDLDDEDSDAAEEDFEPQESSQRSRSEEE